MSHRVGVMYLGRLVEEGPADGVYANQLDPYPEALFSAPLPAHPTKVDEEEEVVLSGEVPTAFDIHDPTAAIFDVAELGAVGDWQELLPALVRQLKALCSAGTAHVEMEG